jgi:hypothetical protein
MPNPDASLDAAERARFDAWITEKWKHGPCPVCQSNSWSRGGKLHQIINSSTLFPEGGTSLPAVSLACQVCGYTMFINAITAGIVEPDEIEEPSEESGEAAHAPTAESK